MGNIRNDFSAKTKELLCIGVCGHCSICGVCTTWVDESTEKKGNIGEAAHIEAASEGGPRYNPQQTEEQRSSFDNGIWLCSNCHTKIDSNPDNYSVSELRAYKAKAMMRAKKNISVSLKGDKTGSNQDFCLAIMSFFSKIYGIQESLHNFIKKINADNLLSEYATKNSFDTQLAADFEFGLDTLSSKLCTMRDLWNIAKQLKDKIEEGRLFIPDNCYTYEQRYFEIIGDCPIKAEEWWRFLNRIKNHFKDLDTINGQILNEYQKQFADFHEGI